MAISQAMCTSFKQQLLQGQHNFTTSTGHTFKLGPRSQHKDLTCLVRIQAPALN
jgi:hypothetical protein